VANGIVALGEGWRRLWLAVARRLIAAARRASAPAARTAERISCPLPRGLTGAAGTLDGPPPKFVAAATPVPTARWADS
jgi:hypothetical protein